jgi:hypothetical protein
VWCPTALREKEKKRKEEEEEEEEGNRCFND